MVDSKWIYKVCLYIKLPSGGFKVDLQVCLHIDPDLLPQVVLWSADMWYFEYVDLETAPEVKKNPLGKTILEPLEQNLEVPPAKLWILMRITRI